MLQICSQEYLLVRKINTKDSQSIARFYIAECVYVCTRVCIQSRSKNKRINILVSQIITIVSRGRHLSIVDYRSSREIRITTTSRIDESVKLYKGSIGENDCPPFNASYLFIEPCWFLPAGESKSLHE